jgi:hypothetical protein
MISLVMGSGIGIDSGRREARSQQPRMTRVPVRLAGRPRRGPNHGPARVVERQL